jgi:hypothetical protein
MSAKLTITVPEWLDQLCTWPVLTFRRLKFGYAFRKIYLGQDEYTIVEPVDYYEFGKFNWIFIRCDKKPYAVSEFKIGRVKTKRMYLHRAIMRAPKRKLVDHRNGDGLDNRRANLRLATHAQNAKNRKKRKNASSRFIGVYLEKRTGRWQTKIYFRGKPISLGCFDSQIDAAKAYDEAARKYHKDFARLNFPEEAPVS